MTIPIVTNQPSLLQHLQHNEDEAQDGIHVAVSMANAEGIQVVSTETGETVNVPLSQDVSE